MFEQYLTKTGRLSPKQPQEIKNAWYIQKFVEVHGTRYDYSKVVFVTRATNVKICCKHHGTFEQTPDSHLNGRGCPECQLQCKRADITELLGKFQQVHSDKYDYSRVSYRNNRELITIICPIHGTFEQNQWNHLSGLGCPSCKLDCRVLYLLKSKGTGLTKIGVTNNLARRLVELGGDVSLIYQRQLPSPRTTEAQLHRKYQKYRTQNPLVNGGNTEFFNLTSEQVADIVRYLEGL